MAMGQGEIAYSLIADSGFDVEEQCCLWFIFNSRIRAALKTWGKDEETKLGKRGDWWGRR